MQLPLTSTAQHLGHPLKETADGKRLTFLNFLETLTTNNHTGNDRFRVQKDVSSFIVLTLDLLSA